ncbi:hypothetical protein EX895_002635 [Sporisorium graminicola]|uniref:Uncharacterized protein n=1 Tax=Sporisorium graminicola TaxID=280036 RepID=A0A4U7KUR6_9BASI|nr:hypothetical protein EX895_002635 [Sporisorium graminicola]TKY88283.1 hypothetical protein EX895_002635 [Sporisorium graminicola]
MSSFYQQHIPLVQEVLASFHEILRHGKSYAAEKALDEAALLQARLAPDMLDLRQQLGCVVRYVNRVLEIGQVGVAKEVSEQDATFDSLTAVIDAVQAQLAKIQPERFNANQHGSVRCVSYPSGYRATIPDNALFMSNLLRPLIFFHLTTTYNILRNQGAPLGKAVYMAPWWNPVFEDAWQNCDPPAADPEAVQQHGGPIDK